MTTSNDIVALFQSMRTAYGPQWKHGEEAIAVWRDALNGSTTEEIRRGCQMALREHVNHPPTLPQFMNLLKSARPRHSTYLPAPSMPLAGRIANRALLKVLQEVGGVDRHQLSLLVQLKNALVEDLNGQPCEAWIDDVLTQLRDLANDYDRAERNKEAHEAWLAYCRKWGISVEQALRNAEKYKPTVV